MLALEEDQESLRSLRELKGFGFSQIPSSTYIVLLVNALCMKCYSCSRITLFRKDTSSENAPHTNRILIFRIINGTTIYERRIGTSSKQRHKRTLVAKKLR